MHICIVTHVFPLNMISPEKIEGSFIVPFVRELQRQGHRVTIFTPNKQGEIVEDPSIEVVRFNWTNWGGTLGNMNLFNPLHMISLGSLFSRGSRGLKRLVKEMDVDHCLAMWAIPSGTFARYAMLKTGVPYSVWCLGTDIHSMAKKPFLKGLVCKSLKDAAHLFADGYNFAGDVEKISKRSCSFLPTVRIVENLVSSKVALPADRFNFLYIGRLEKVKGIDVLIDAYNDLLKITDKVHLSIIGEGSLEEYLKEKVDEYAIAEFLDFIGYIPDELRAGYLDECDCQVIPSRNESIPLVLTEAVKSGIKLLVSDVSDMGLMSRKYQLGIVVPPDNIPTLKEGMLTVMKGSGLPVPNRDGYLAHFDLALSVQGLVKEITGER